MEWNTKFLGKYSQLIYWVQPLVADTNSYMMLARRLVHKCTPQSMHRLVMSIRERKS